MLIVTVSQFFYVRGSAHGFNTSPTFTSHRAAPVCGNTDQQPTPGKSSIKIRRKPRSRHKPSPETARM